MGNLLPRWTAGRRLGRLHGRRGRVFVVDSTGAKPRRVCPDGYELWPGSSAVSPDGRFVAARSPENQVGLCPVDGGEPRPVPGLVGPYVPVRWSSDGRSLFVFRTGELPALIQRVDVTTGNATLWKQLAPPDAAGVRVTFVAMTPDATSYGYFCEQFLRALYLVESLGSWEKPSFWSRLLGRGR